VAAQDGPGQRAIAVRTLAFAPVTRAMPGVRLGPAGVAACRPPAPRDEGAEGVALLRLCACGGGWGRLKAGWQAEYDTWNRRRLDDLEPVYVWADGIYVQAGLEKDKAAMLVLIAALRDGRKVVLAVESGYRESTESWAALLRDLTARGLRAPRVVGTALDAARITEQMRRSSPEIEQSFKLAPQKLPATSKPPITPPPSGQERVRPAARPSSPSEVLEPARPGCSS
jgi:hypothetical protein